MSARLRRRTLLTLGALALMPESVEAICSGSAGAMTADTGGAAQAAPAFVPMDVTRSVAFMDELMDRYHRSIDVYTDDSSPGNHFVAPARMSEKHPETDSARPFTKQEIDRV